MPFFITPLIVSKAGRHGLRASPGLLRELEKCCLAGTGKRLLSGCMPWSLVSRFSDHKKPQRTDLAGFERSPSAGSALRRAKPLSAATEGRVVSL